MFGLTKKEITKRNPIIFQTARFISNMGYRFLSNIHIEKSENMALAKKTGSAVFLYIGLHKSLWETTGVLSCIDSQNFFIPFVGMGDNLVKGKFFQAMTIKAGTFLVKRPENRKEILESSLKLKQYTEYYLSNGIDVMIFPEGTRRNVPDKGQYGQFFPAAFEAALEYEKDKVKILAQYPQLKPLNIYIIPFNTDYSRIREAHEMIGDQAKRPRTLHVLDSLKMLKHIGDIYISFGEPVKIADQLDKNRKELAVDIRSMCLELVKILPINIVARAAVNTIESGNISQENFLDFIRRTIETLLPYRDRFRGFQPGDPSESILKSACKYEPIFKNITPDHIHFYRLYANYIYHYWDTVAANKSQAQ